MFIAIVETERDKRSFEFYNVTKYLLFARERHAGLIAVRAEILRWSSFSILLLFIFFHVDLYRKISGEIFDRFWLKKIVRNYLHFCKPSYISEFLTFIIFILLFCFSLFQLKFDRFILLSLFFILKKERLD